MKILIDMNLSPEWVLVFAKYSIDSVHWSNVGDPTATDQIIMAWAVTNGYIVFTHDLDFGILLATTEIRRAIASLFQKSGFSDNFCISPQYLGGFSADSRLRSSIFVKNPASGPLF